MYYINGDRYEGDWKNDKDNGKGIYNWNDNERYEGDFKDGKYEGKVMYRKSLWYHYSFLVSPFLRIKIHEK